MCLEGIAVDLHSFYCYFTGMRFSVRHIIYPEGDKQEIDHSLTINQLVDINGGPLPASSIQPRMISYRVGKISTQSLRNEEITNYHLELVRREELEEIMRSGD